MISNLKINNFKKHAQLEVNFTEGLNGIFGPNYTGKSTILYAILFALGGASHVPGSNLQKKGTASGMSVEMTFDIAGKDYTVTRKKTGAYLHKGEEMIASGTSNVTAKIEELLGMSIKRFRQLKYAEQKKAHALLTLGANDLHKIIEELTGVDQVNTVLDKLKPIVSESKGALDVLTFEDTSKLMESIAAIAVKLGGLEDCDLAETKEALAEAEDADVILTGKVGACEKADRLYRKAMEAKNSKEHMITHLEEDITFQKGKLTIADLDAEWEELDHMKDGIEKFTKSMAEAVRKNDQYESLQAEQEKLDKSISRTKKIMDGLVEELFDIDDNIEQLTEDMVKEVDDAKDFLQQNKAEIKSLKHLLEEESCPTCERPYDELDSPVDKDKLMALEETVSKDELDLKLNKNELKKFTTLVTVKNQLVEDINRNAKSLEDSSAERTDRRAEMEALETPDMDNMRLAEKHNKKNSKEREGRVEDYFLEVNILQTIEGHRDKLTDLRQEIEDIEIPEHDVEELDSLKLLKTQQELLVKTTTRKLTDLEMVIAALVAQLKAEEGELERVYKSNVTYEKAKATHGVAKSLQKYLRDNRDRYSGQIWEFFLGSASSFVSDCTNGAISEIQRVDSGAFQYVEGEEVFGIKDASGAQEAVMGVAVQIALSEAAVCPLDILLVDEPTADMDENHALSLSALLSTKGSQVIAISHREMDSSICNNAIHLGV